MKISRKINRYKSYLINLIVPAVVFGFITGTLTAIIVTLYKLVAKHIISFSATGYAFFRERPQFIPLIVIGLFIISVLLAFLFKLYPNVKGGGIPTSVGILRGLITFKWLRSLIGVFALSLLSFLLGVPVGNEGPSVQMGTSIGRGSVYLFAKKHRAWDRYSMTGGACAGFSVATGAPISGILFAIEEAHQRISPTIMIMASSTVLFSNITAEIFSPILGVSTKLFENLNIRELQLSSLWIPVIVGLAVGIIGAILLTYYQIISKLLNKKLSKIRSCYKIFAVLTLTMCMGLISFSTVSIGHDLTHLLLEGDLAISGLILILIIRSTLTFSANSSGITGGMFLPVLALGAIISSVVGKIMISAGISPELQSTIVVLGIIACLAGIMKSPLTAIVFAIEAMECHNNIIAVIIVSVLAYLITEMLETKSINDTAMEYRIEQMNEGKEATVIDTVVTVKDGAFAVGKQVRDIFWPANLFVLSVKKAREVNAEVDGHGGKALNSGDVLHIQYSTYNECETKSQLEDIVGKQ